MGKKDETKNSDGKVEAVLQILRKQSPLTVKQEKFCNKACVERFLNAKGDNVKKAAKSLRACLTWRDSICTDHLIADEFSAEVAEGVAYVAGHDQDSRPVLIFRIKQDYQKFHSQKMFTRLLVFTLEVAVGTMTKNTDQFVILLDASFFRSASAFLTLLLTTLKTVSDYYPGRLHKAFVLDPPSFFSYLWKGVRPFTDFATTTFIVASIDFEDSSDFDDFSSYPRAASLRFDSTSTTTAKIGACSSSRFAFTVSTNFDTLKPWYLTLSDTSSTGSQIGPTTSPSPSLLGPALISPLNARSFSFASPTARAPRGFNSYSYAKPVKRNVFCPSTPLPARSESMCDPNKPVLQPRTPKPSFLQSPGLFFKKERDSHQQGSASSHSTRSEKAKDAFGPYLKFYRRPYDEMIYRAKMRPPLGGLISIVQPHLKRRHASVSQRF
uniref:CRAL-TRIO domain-containing protein n=2 Tax=Kalanchoe fedtschenkoi TaxID=63787 RepID=A0A7N0VHF6_KALFE